MSRTSTRRMWKGAWRGCVAASGYWLLDALVHLLGMGAPLSGAMLPDSPHELLMRTTAALLLMVGTALVYFFSARRREAEEAARCGEAEFRILVESIGEGMLRVDPSGRILLANPAADSILGMAPGGLAGTEIWDYVDEGQRAVLRQAMERRRVGERSSYHLEILRRDGTRRNLLVTGEPYFGADGTPGGSVAILRDDTERQRILTEIRNRDAILEAVVLSVRRLLQKGWDLGAGELLATLGRATGVSRVSIFENVAAPGGEPLMRRREQWAAEGVPHQIDGSSPLGFSFGEAGLGRWAEGLSAGEGICGRVCEFPASERAFLEPRQVLSVAAFPIAVEGSWWGFVGFEDCATQRVWSAAETGALKLVAEVIGSALQQRRIERERLRLATAIENAQETVVITDLEGSIEYANPAFTAITGYTPQEARGLNPNILNSGQHDRAFFEKLWETLLSGETWRGQFINRKKDGTLYREDATISPIREPDGALSGFVAVKKDVTEVAEMRSRLEALREVETLGRFFAGVAHEVRNPLQAIVGAAESLREPGAEDAGRNEMVDLIHGQTARLSHLMAELLDMAQPGGEREVSPLDVLAVAERALAQAAEKYPARAEDLSVSGDTGSTAVLGSEGKLGRVVGELLENALQHSPPGSPVGVYVSLEGREVVLRVRDRGAGVPADYQEVVFRPFFTLRPGSTGLGLNYVRVVLARCGGTAVLQNNPDGVGCTAEIRLPAAL